MKLGIIGGGQLGQLIAISADPLGIEVTCLTEHADIPARHVSNLFVTPRENTAQIAEFAKQMDIVTFENENIDAELIDIISPHAPVYPNKKSLLVSQDRLLEKRLFNQLKIPTTEYYPVDSLETLSAAMLKLGGQAMLKTRRFGYDGKGQWLLTQDTNMQLIWESVHDTNLIVENFITFEKEVSLIAVRSRNGECGFYPLTENIHQHGILRYSIAPLEDFSLQQRAEEYAKRIFNELDYVGVLAIEFFIKEKNLYANEMAPRVHNSGHWTIQGTPTSQFENHLRAIFDLPIGHTNCSHPTAMINFIGALPDLPAILRVPGTHYYQYHKEPRPNRKLGHVTIIEEYEHKLRNKIELIQRICGNS